MREAKDTGQEEAEGLSFLPRAISAPRKPMYLSDNQCSEKTLSFWQLASVVIQEGEEPYTTNLCQKCCNDSLKAKWENTNKLGGDSSRGERRTVENFLK